MLVRLHGGLGNQLFQLLAARYISKKNEVAIEIFAGDLKRFQTKRLFEIIPLLRNETLVEQIDLVDHFLLKNKISKIAGKFSFHSIASVSQVNKWNGQILNGYFHDIFNYKDYSLVACLVKEIDADLQRIAPINPAHFSININRSGAIHLRLGDFLQIGKGRDFLLKYRLPFIKETAAKLLEKQEVDNFIVFTDDPVKARQLLSGPEYIFLEDLIHTKLSLLHEFNLLTKFIHIIPSNSTFSYWTSILGNRKTVYFSPLWKNDDKIENAIFLENIQLHQTIFPQAQCLIPST